MPKTHVPINPAVLGWMIDESGLSAGEVADKAKVDESTLRAWLGGDLQPSMGEFTRVRNALRRPSALFFLAEPPAASSIPDALRSAPGRYGHDLRQDERRWVRRSLRLQRLISILRDRRGLVVGLPEATVREQPEVASARVREWLGISIGDQASWESDSDAWRGWRTALEESGLLVFLLQLGRDGIRGFSVGDRSAPLVAVNSTYNASARSFTLFHELAHLALRDDSACADVAPGPQKTGNISVERWCEAFAAAFLMPEESVRDAVASFQGAFSGFELVENVAEEFGVSLRAAAIRLIRLGYESGDLYAQVDSEARVMDRHKGFARGRPQHRPRKRFNELGVSTVTELIDAARIGILNERDLRNYLRADGSEIAEMSELADAESQ